MTAHEEQDERVVLILPIPAIDCGRLLPFECYLQGREGFAPSPGQRAAEMIGHAPGGDLDQPAARIVGHALFGPLHGRREQRLLNGILGGEEVAEAPDHGAENLRRKLAQQVLIDGVHDSRLP
jgi:hypothetical protein